MQKTAQMYDAKYDIVKFFLSILVVAIHAQLYPLALYPWLRIAVPLFFMMSSYFVFSKLQAAAPEEHKAIVKNFVLRNVKLYCFWFVVLLPLTMYIKRKEYFSNGFVMGIFSFLRSLFFGSTFAASWYITAAVIGTALIYLLSKKLRSGVILGITLAVFGFVTLWSSYEQVFQQTAFLQRLEDAYRLVFLNPALSFPASLIWVFAGKCFAERKARLPAGWLCILLFAVSCVGLYLEWRLVRALNGSYDNDSYFMLLPTCVSLFAWLQTAKVSKLRQGRYLRRASTVIYALHASIVPVFAFLAEKLLHIQPALLVFLMTFACCVAAYLCLEGIIGRFPDSKLARLLKNAY